MLCAARGTCPTHQRPRPRPSRHCAQNQAYSALRKAQGELEALQPQVANDAAQTRLAVQTEMLQSLRVGMADTEVGRAALLCIQ